MATRHRGITPDAKPDKETGEEEEEEKKKEKKLFSAISRIVRSGSGRVKCAGQPSPSNKQRQQLALEESPTSGAQAMAAWRAGPFISGGAVRAASVGPAVCGPDGCVCGAVVQRRYQRHPVVCATYVRGLGACECTPYVP